MERSLFLSYNTADSNFVRRLAKDCERSGVHVFYFEKDLKPGENIWARIADKIQTSAVVGVVLSPQSASSRGVLREIEYAYQYFGETEGISLVPILKEPIAEDEIPRKLQGLLWADFTKSYTSGLRQLLKSFEIDIPFHDEHALVEIFNSKDICDFSFHVLKTAYEITRERYIQLIVQGLEKQAIHYVVIADSIPRDSFRYRLVTLTGIIGQSIISGVLLDISNVDETKGYIKAEPKTKSEMVVPISGNKYGVIGAINFESHDIDGFHNVDKQRLFELANLAGDVLETRKWVPAPVGHLPSLGFPQISRDHSELPSFSPESIAAHIEQMQAIQDEMQVIDVKDYHVTERIRHAKDLESLGFINKAIALLESAPSKWRDFEN